MGDPKTNIKQQKVEDFKSFKSGANLTRRHVSPSSMAAGRQQLTPTCSCLALASCCKHSEIVD